MSTVEKNVASAELPVATKRPYGEPALLEYGDIDRITQNANKTVGAGDNMDATKTK